MSTAAVVIGRNEGARLVRCLASLEGRAAPVVYVDSGSTDGSVAAARAAGAEVVELDLSIPFTAARSRNAGLARLAQIAPGAAFVQVVDGDCELREGWIETAARFLEDNPQAAAVAGRLRERFPEATLWNRLADREWDTAPGRTAAVGGIAMLRRAAVEAVGGYREAMIAGEEPELCLRLGRAGWQVWRLAAEMAWHDVAMTRMSQWWRRTRRGGFAFAEGAALHGAGPERYRVAETRRALAWGLGVPAAAILGAALLTPWALAVLALWPAQVARLRARGLSWTDALFLTLAKLPEAQGVVEFAILRLRGRRRGLIEYKDR